MFVAIALAAYAGVAIVRREALRRGMLDRPNARSSHAAPTPRGGGIAVVIVILAVLMFEGLDGQWPSRFPLVIGAVMLVALTGLLDDRFSLPVLPRLGLHLVAGLGFAFFAMTAAPGALPAPVWIVVWCLWAVSCVNVANFIDGIDGLLGLQAAVFGGYMVALSIPQSFVWAFGIALLASSVGFLVWNWAPARIFLGDSGSGAYGVLFAVGGVLLVSQTAVPVWLVWLPLYPMFLDAALTLLSRWRRGERLTEAHRQHLYQRLALRWGHAPVALLYAAAAGAGAVMVANRDRLGVVAVAFFVMGVAAAGALLGRTVARGGRPA